ncbi:MAG: hypothetical protein MUP63_02875 [Candidatus Nanohaloarchaeota archaeon QJJ-7]|nr:hypothetical protein [Candidatus Nanohaloarchaeota archaeon QJJ-7]
MDIEEKNAVSATNVLNVLEGIEDRNEVQRDTFEHLKKNLAVHSDDTLEELIDELEEIDSLKDKHVLKIIETLPRSEQEVQALFSKERIKLDDSEVEKIVEFADSVGSR